LSEGEYCQQELGLHYALSVMSRKINVRFSTQSHIPD
jgi:hypothetical protein